MQRFDYSHYIATCSYSPADLISCICSCHAMQRNATQPDDLRSVVQQVPFLHAEVQHCSKWRKQVQQISMIPYLQHQGREIPAILRKLC